MKITYLGTAASEGFPAVFCNCEYCREARKLGGKNIRTRSQTMINDDLLIDFPADTYSHFLNNHIEGDKIKYVLITHSHSDHLYEKEFDMRLKGFSHNPQVERLKVYCNEGAFEKINMLYLKDRLPIDFQMVKPFETINEVGYTITSLPARHAPGDNALIYIIQAEKTLLYAHDTGYFYDEVFEYIKEKSFKFDLISLDCTNVDITIGDDGNHMGIDNIQRVIKRLESIGAINDKTQKVINHFSHNANPLHHVLEERVSKLGYKVSYDGLSISL